MILSYPGGPTNHHKGPNQGKGEAEVREGDTVTGLRMEGGQEPRTGGRLGSGKGRLGLLSCSLWMEPVTASTLNLACEMTLGLLTPRNASFCSVSSH